MELINEHKLDYLPEIFSIEELRLLFSYLRFKYETQKRTLRGWVALRDWCIITLMYDCALRPLECLRLKINDIDFKNRRITIQNKNNRLHRGRTITISNTSLALLKLFILNIETRKRMHEYIFPTTKHDCLAQHSWKWQFHEILMKAGLYKQPTRTTHGHYSSYTLRHTRATYLYNQTKDILLVANFLGHTTLNATKVYIHLSRVANGYFDYMRKAQERLNLNQGF